MTTIKINTIEKLINELNKYDKHLPVAVFDKDKGYISVAFKKEVTQKDGNVFQWLSLFAHETRAMYDIETLLGYLNKLPSKATILKQTEEKIFTSLYLSIDGMKENNQSYQWLVINDEWEYDRFFRKHEKEPKKDQLEKALEKMLLEVKQESSESVERIHQYLCKQTDERLFKGILTDGKTIKGSLAYCSDKAQETARNDRFAMVEDDTVYQWVKDYFILYELPKKVEKKQTKKKAPVNNVVASPTKSNMSYSEQVMEEKGESEQQLELFATA